VLFAAAPGRDFGVGGAPDARPRRTRSRLFAAVSPILARVLADPLNTAEIEQALAALTVFGARAPAVRVVDDCPSTNALLLAESAAAGAALLAAEVQTAGRGRRGRRWISPRGAGLTFSLRRVLDCAVRQTVGLPLVAGVAAARTLRDLGAEGITLKWPNDLMAGGAKLGGVLIETRPAPRGTLVVIGIGINCRAVPRTAARFRRQVVALEQLMQSLPSRNLLVAQLAAALLTDLERFERSGLEAVRADWEALHADAGRRLRVRLRDGRHVRQVTGVAQGLAPDGGLQLRTRSGLRNLDGARVVSARAA